MRVEDVLTVHLPNRASFSTTSSFGGFGASGIRPPKKLAGALMDFCEPETKPGNRGFHLLLRAKLEDLRERIATLELILNTFGTHPRVDMEDKVSLS